MRYALLCTIDPDKLDLFGTLRADHYDYLIKERGRIAFGGPARANEGGRPEMMIIIVEVASLAEAEAFIANEPYNHAGGFSKVIVRPWSQVIPEAEPGALLAARDEELRRRGADRSVASRS